MARALARPARRRAQLVAAAVLVLAGAIAGVPDARGDHGKVPPKPDGGMAFGTTVTTEHLESLASKQVITTMPTLNVVANAVSSDEVHIYLVGKLAPPEHDYARGGDVPDFKVKTLAFGMVPAVVELRIRQLVYGRDARAPRRDLAGHLEPWVLRVDGSLGSRGDHRVEGRVRIEVVGMTLDGQRVDLGKSCATASPGLISLASVDEYSPIGGGVMKGAVDIPAFAGCGGLANLITAAMSGAGNPIRTRQGSLL